MSWHKWHHAVLPLHLMYKQLEYTTLNPRVSRQYFPVYLSPVSTCIAVNLTAWILYLMCNPDHNMNHELILCTEPIVFPCPNQVFHMDFPADFPLDLLHISCVFPACLRDFAMNFPFPSGLPIPCCGPPHNSSPSSSSYTSFSHKSFWFPTDMVGRPHPFPHLTLRFPSALCLSP